MTDEEYEKIEGCFNCKNRKDMKTPENKCFPEDDELQFSFCNYQYDKDWRKENDTKTN